jgi:Flp pilus assembly protein TadG
MQRRSRKSGATLLECAFTLPIMFVLLFGMLDLGLAAARYNALAEASRRVAREAIIHGSVAAKMTSMWGPDEYVGTAADSSDIAATAAPVLLAMPKERVNIRVAWIDNDNSPHDRVRVEVSFQHEPMIPSLFAWGTLDLRSVSTMRIVN